MTVYLHRSPGDEARMDVKMVQQWELFVDPILKIGGYDKTTSSTLQNVKRKKKRKET